MRWYASLRRRGEIASVRRSGAPVRSGTLVAYAAAGRPGSSRVVVTVSKSVGGAVVRNRVRRRIKGALDRCAPPRVPLRVVLIAQPAAAAHSYARIEADVAGVMQRLTRARSG